MLHVLIPALFVVIWSTGFIVAKAALPHADLQLFQSIGLATPKSVNDNGIGSGDLSIVLFAEQ